MKKIQNMTGKAVPLEMSDVDTDLIIPAQYLTNVSMLGYGENVFRRLRDNDPHCVFNQEKFADANILISQDNFGCGSSREHAVWALLNAGIEAIIAKSFADIFYSNSAKNGLVLITLPSDSVDSLIASSREGQLFLEISIKEGVIQSQDQQYPFHLDTFNQHCFLKGLDHLDYILSHQAEINQWDADAAHRF